jgi:hypothetical protein
VLGCRDARAAEDGQARLIQYANDALTVHLGSVPILDVLQELGLQSGAEVRGQVREPRDVTADFESVPLPQALTRLLGDQNFALVYTRDGRLKAVRLLGGVQGVSPPPVVVSAAPAALHAPLSGNLQELIARHPPVPVTGAVADALQAPSATLQQLIELSLHHQDPNVRAEALRTGMATVEAERELYSAVIKELNDSDSESLANRLHAAAGEHAEDVANDVLREAHAAQIRLMATSVLQWLRRGT